MKQSKLTIEIGDLDKESATIELKLNGVSHTMSLDDIESMYKALYAMKTSIREQSLGVFNGKILEDKTYVPLFGTSDRKGETDLFFYVDGREHGCEPKILEIDLNRDSPTCFIALGYAQYGKLYTLAEILKFKVIYNDLWINKMQQLQAVIDMHAKAKIRELDAIKAEFDDVT